MDDLMLMLRLVRDAERAMQRLVTVLDWARMNLKAEKSRSLVMVHGRLMNVKPFAVKGVTIPSIQEKPVKSLGRIIDATLSDKLRKAELEASIEEDLKLLNKSQLTGVMKAWAYQFMVLPRIGWRLMLYEIPMSWVEKMEARINTQLRRWLGISKNTTTVALFCPKSPCALPLSSLGGVFKKVKSGAVMQLKHSRDLSVAGSWSSVKTSKKWNVGDAVTRAESRLRLDKTVGNGQFLRAGLGYIKREENPQPGTPAYRKAVTSCVGKEEAELQRSVRRFKGTGRNGSG